MVRAGCAQQVWKGLIRSVSLLWDNAGFWGKSLQEPVCVG